MKTIKQARVKNETSIKCYSNQEFIHNNDLMNNQSIIILNNGPVIGNS